MSVVKDHKKQGPEENFPENRTARRVKEALQRLPSNISDLEQTSDCYVAHSEL